MKKTYHLLTMKIVRLRQSGIISTSGVGATRSGYGVATEYSWDDEE